MKVLARHKWVARATITESVGENNWRRFKATICGWGGWLVWEGPIESVNADRIIAAVKAVRDRIEANDESVFSIGKNTPLVPA